MLTQYAEKYLLALKCLLAAAALDREHPKVHEQIIRFKQIIDKDAETLAPQTAEIIKSEFTLLPASTSLSQYNDEYLSKHKDSARHTLSASRVHKLLSPDSAARYEKDAANVIKLPSITMDEAKEALDLLRSWNSSEADGFRTSAAAKWPNATAFAASG
jgi:peptide alpha-N-acetyltransferase